MFKEFKDFAMGGNVIDMAVGIIIGAAFGTIVKSLVADIIMPPIGLLLGGVDFSNLSWVIQEASADAEAVAINYGTFVNHVISFLIVAFSIFIVVRSINRLRKQEEEEPAAEEAPRQEVLLEEIRDLLKKNQ